MQSEQQVMVTPYWPPTELEKNIVLLRSYIASIRRQGREKIFPVESALPSLSSSS